MLKSRKKQRGEIMSEKKENPFSGELTGKEMMFCIEYVSNGYNMYRAAVKAGYTKSYAKSKSYLLMDKVGIRKTINELMREKATAVYEKGVADEKELREFWTDIVRGTLQNPNALNYQDYLKEEQEQLSFMKDSTVTYSSENKKIPLGMRLKASELLYKAQTDGFCEEKDETIKIGFDGEENEP